MVEKDFWPKKVTDNWSGKWKHDGKGYYKLKKEGGHENGTRGKKLHFNEIKSEYGIQSHGW